MSLWDKELKRPWGVRPRTALEKFVDTIDVTGGIFEEMSSGEDVLEADPDWIDLLDAYLDACAELGIEPCRGEERYL